MSVVQEGLVSHLRGALEAVFQKVMSLAPKYGLRIVAINRRDHPGSTPFTPAELQVLASGTDEEKGSFVRARGLELATFADNFIKQNNLPPISEDGKGGGIALLGWSLGSTVTLACVANIDSLPAEVQSRFKLYLRAHILQGMLAWSFSKSSVLTVHQSPLL